MDHFWFQAASIIVYHTERLCLCMLVALSIMKHCTDMHNVTCNALHIRNEKDEPYTHFQSQGQC